jgi:hypothetical protein
MDCILQKLRELLTQGISVTPQAIWIFIIHPIYKHSIGLLLKHLVNQGRSTVWLPWAQESKRWQNDYFKLKKKLIFCTQQISNY